MVHSKGLYLFTQGNIFKPSVAYLWFTCILCEILREKLTGTEVPNLKKSDFGAI